MVSSDPDEARLSRFIDELYEAAVDQSLWWSNALKLAHLFESGSCMLLLANGRGGGRFLGVTDNIRGEVWEDYENHYFARDQWVTGALMRPGRARLGHELAPLEWFKASEFLNQLYSRSGLHSFLGAAFPLGDERSGVIAIHRQEHAVGFDRDDVARLDALIPHLRRVMQLTVRHSRSVFDHQAALDGLERSHSATIVVDAHGAILFATELAEAILRRNEGLRTIKGRLGSANARVAARLTLLIRAAAGSAAAGPATTAPRCGGVAIERGEDRLPLTVLVAPFRQKRTAFGAALAAALVLIRDPETSSLAVDVLKDLFALTPAQAAVAARLADGQSLETIAAQLRISLHTARDHLKVVFAKTGTSRQSQLVALLTRTVAALGTIGYADPAEAGQRRA